MDRLPRTPSRRRLPYAGDLPEPLPHPYRFLTSGPIYVERAHGLRPPSQSTLRVFDGGHFDLYIGPHADANARLQAEFLAHHLLARAG